MRSLRVLSAAAALALVLPMATPSFAQGHGGHGGGGGHFAGGGGGAHFGGGGARMGGFSGGAHFGGGGGGFAAAARPNGGVAFNGGGRNFAASGGHWNGGGNWHGNGWHHRGGFWPGFAAGAAIGGLGSYAYYGGGPYYGDNYYDDGYYDDSASVAVVPDTGGDSSAYCAQRYRSYDPASGTYLGYDGLRHPCP
ncbi:BA14K family protein [Bradyrhizobium sp. WYCCWR 13023]|uniref:Lectin-like protein BA14k n=1 Tax=Bradyrhizobium zhengyangense TaxID=2911009 RepID=A0A9X1RKW6_9BRAD|nr:BA14K family protein [Bradyrhizobium zhengyangense]MCG2632095.1 BA14K family protein [Bradyrhizobium zhengyangense]MCG2637671.1 BA14K family protein [Bradyrhizobium zhengyangense]MCG2666067.1 BA14K family protein [Bradyrhizobium zhengyangense]